MRAEGGNGVVCGCSRVAGWADASEIVESECLGEDSEKVGCFLVAESEANG